MVVCRYFLQPSGCRFGDNCRFEHVDDGGYDVPSYAPRGGPPPQNNWQSGGRDYNSPRYPSVPQRSYGTRGGYEQHGSRGNNPGYQNVGHRQPFYESSQRFTSAVAHTTDAEILEDVSMDIRSLWAQTSNSVFQKGKIWPFSSYSYISPDGTVRTDPLFGLADHSMEELRAAAYAARSDPNALQAYVQEVSTQGNQVRLMCTDICNAADLPHSEGAKKIIAEVRSKAAQHETATRQTEMNQPSAFSASQPTPFSSPAPQQQQSVFAFQSPSHQAEPRGGVPGAMQGGVQGNMQGIVQGGAQGGGVYSDTNMLSAEDFLQFASPEFTYGKVPFRPPPRNLC